MKKSRVLFILKRREDFSAPLHSAHKSLSTGLYNSAKLVDQMLTDAGVDSHLEVVVDNNDIDRVIVQHRPTHAIVEALWCVPSKFSVLTKLHPTVTWIVRLHSEMPFLANEGIAMDWVADYARYPQVKIGINSPRLLREIGVYLAAVLNLDASQVAEKLIYMPNFYEQEYVSKPFVLKDNTINISCFGAVRPMKNQLLQAVAALEFAEENDLKLRFHINGNRLEMKGEPVLHNMKAMFEHLSDRGHELVQHAWAPREEFLEICASMDIGMQISFSETFNIVGADLISQGVPLVGSDEIPWAPFEWCANPVSSLSMVEKLQKTLGAPDRNVWAHQQKLTAYTNQTRDTWVKYFGEQK